MCWNRFIGWGPERRSPAGAYPATGAGTRLALGGLLLAAVAACTSPAAPPPTAVRLVDHDELVAEVARHRGRVVVLDCWSTSCPPCVREFPGLVALAERHGSRVACLSLSFDYEGIGSPEDAVPRVREFLERVGASRVINMLSREEADTMYGKLRLTSVPAVYVWGPDGELARRFDDDLSAQRGRPFTYADIGDEVASLLQR